MHTSRVTRYLGLFVAAFLGFLSSGAGTAHDAEAGPPAQQRKANSSPSVPSLGDLSRRASRCGVREPAESQRLAIDQAASARASKDHNGIVTIPVYWHIITTSTGGGNITGLVPAQMAVLNEAFERSGFAFNVAGLQVVPNDAWFFAEAESAEEQQMKAALRRGGPDALNIYTTNGDVFLGWATFPFNYKFLPSYDGVVLWWAALPGTGLAGEADEEPDGVLTYDQGDTATHEVGHWLGLHHTFAGGCSHPGDSIKDTPAEAEPQFFCAPRDSCIGPPFRGADPITNFMDYVDDVCMTHFTPEQTKRMRKHWHAFRDKKARS